MSSPLSKTNPSQLCSTAEDKKADVADGADATPVVDVADAKPSHRHELAQIPSYDIDFLRAEEVEGSLHRFVAADHRTGSPMSATGDRKPLVLAVEDDKDTQQYVRMVLSADYEILLASSAEEARRHLSEHPGIDVVLMDLALRDDEDGLMLASWLRTTSQWKDLPIIATTAQVLPEVRRAALDGGCDSFLTKPISPGTLRAEVREVLTGARNLSRDPDQQSIRGRKTNVGQRFPSK